MKIRVKGPVEVEFEFDDKKLDALIEKFVSCIKRCDMGYVPEQTSPNATPEEDNLDGYSDVDLFAPLDDDCVDVESDTASNEGNADVEPDTAQTGQQGKTGGKQCAGKRQAKSPKPGRTEQEVEDFKNMLGEIAKNAENFEQFVEKVAQQLELGKQAEFFKQVVYMATKVEVISWPAIEKELGDTSSKQAMLSPKLKKKKAPNTLYLLNMLIQYKDYSFGDKQPEAGPAAPTEKDTKEVTLSDEEATTKHVLMKCLAGADLGEIDTKWSLDEKLKFLLGNMGLQEKSEKEQNEILGIAIEAVKSELRNDDDVDRVIRKAKPEIPADRVILPRMRLAQFIKDYSGKNVKVLTFLQDLKGVLTM